MLDEVSKLAQALAEVEFLFQEGVIFSQVDADTLERIQNDLSSMLGDPFFYVERVPNLA